MDEHVPGVCWKGATWSSACRPAPPCTRIFHTISSSFRATAGPTIYSMGMSERHGKPFSQGVQLIAAGAAFLIVAALVLTWHGSPPGVGSWWPSRPAPLPPSLVCNVTCSCDVPPVVCEVKPAPCPACPTCDKALAAKALAATKLCPACPTCPGTATKYDISHLTQPDNQDVGG